MWLPTRLLEFLDGVMLEDVGYSEEICRQVGRLLAQFHSATSTFEDAAYRRHIPFISWRNVNCCEREAEILYERKLICKHRYTLLKQTFETFTEMMRNMSDAMTQGKDSSKSILHNSG